MRITPSMLKQHNKRDDAWSAINDKVYNVTPYLSFHPGGEKELMRVAGRDGTKLFGEIHFFLHSVVIKTVQPQRIRGLMWILCSILALLDS